MWELFLIGFGFVLGRWGQQILRWGQQILRWVRDRFQNQTDIPIL